MPITTDSVTPVSSMALRNASMPSVSWTKLRKCRWPSTSSYFGAGFGASAAEGAMDTGRGGARKKPGVNLILNLLCGRLPQQLAARAALDPSAPLLKFKLLQVTDGGTEGQAPLLARTLKLDDRIASFLLGHRQIDARLERLARIVVPQANAGDTMAAQEFYQRADRFLHAYFKDPQSAGRNVLLYLHGPANSDQRLVVEAVCRNYDLPLLVADVEAVKTGPLPFEQTAWLLAREATLQSAVLCLENMDCLIAEADKHAAELKSLLEAAKTFSRLTDRKSTRLNSSHLGISYA